MKDILKDFYLGKEINKSEYFSYNKNDKKTPYFNKEMNCRF